MNVGIVSLWWPPHFGGGEVYAYRLALALRQSAIDVEAITTSPCRANRENGDIEVLRTGADHDPRSMKAFREYLQGPDHAAWCDRVALWAGEHRFTHILCNAPLTRPGFSPAAPRLFTRLRETGAKVGAIHYDFGPRTVSSLLSKYADCGDWARTAAIVAEEQRNKAATRGARAFHETFGSPLTCMPDFVLSCSRWSGSFIDPLEQVPKFVLRPLLPSAAAAVGGPVSAFDQVTVSMINPLLQKGALNMANVVLFNRRNWTFRILQGAWGQSFEGFTPMIGDALRERNRRVTMLPYARDMAAFYRATRVFMFPSRIEGYGMAPVEAMQAGTPVVATDYPAIIEAVGEGARIVPYFADGREWIEAIAEVLANVELWRGKAAARARVLEARQAEELAAFIDFLRTLPATAASAPDAGDQGAEADTSFPNRLS